MTTVETNDQRSEAMMVTQRRVRSCLLQGLLALVWAAAPATPASAARSLSWSAGRVSGSPILIAVACPASNLCVAFGEKVLVSKDPSAGARSWQPVPGLHIPPNLLSMESINIYDVACPSTHLCLTGAGGQLVYATNPLGGASAWRKLTLDTSGEIAAISCPSAHFCVALIQVPPNSGDSNGTGEVFFSTNPVAHVEHIRRGHCFELSSPRRGALIRGVMPTGPFADELAGALLADELSQGS